MTRESLLLISGSLRESSINSATIRTAAKLIEPEAEARVYEEMGLLPHFDPDLEARELPQIVERLRRAIEECTAMLICTPEYAGSLPGSFKNMLDWTVGGVEMVDKPTAWINVSGNATKAQGAHATLRTVLTYTGNRIVDEACLHAPMGRADISEDGLVVAAPIIAQIRGAIQAVLAPQGQP